MSSAGSAATAATVCGGGGRRVGFIGLGPRSLWDGIYRWSADGPSGETISHGEAKSLSDARRQVEEALTSA